MPILGGEKEVLGVGQKVNRRVFAAFFVVMAHGACENNCYIRAAAA